MSLADMRDSPERVLESLLQFLGLDWTDGMAASSGYVYNRTRTGCQEADEGQAATTAALQRLRAFYRPHDERLFKMLGRSLW